MLLFAERRLEAGVSAFAGQAAALPGTEAEREASTRGLDHTEVYPLLMFAVGGMMLFPTANDLLTMFVALEVLSLPLYLLCGLARRRRLLSQEAALKYFLLGAFSSGFFLYGVALIYGFAGSMQFADINEAVRNDTSNSALLLIGMGMLAVGLLFKVGAVPFQAWTPDVYQGAPTAVTAFMAACTKIAAFGALLRLFYVAFGADRWDWQPMLWIIAILTMVFGAILAVVQTDMKRMLAYSSVAHTGFLLTGLLGVQASSALGTDEITSLQAVLFLWGLILIFALGGVLLFAERRLEGGVSAFAGQAAALPGTEAEREASTQGLEHTEVYPLLLFAVGGMMLFPAANDLLTMFVALEVLSLPLYLLCGLARRRRLLEPGGGAQVLPARRVRVRRSSSTASALLYGYAGLDAARRHRRRRVAQRHLRPALLLVGIGLLVGRAAVQGRCGAVPRVDARRLPGRAHRRSPRSWRRAPRSRRSVRCCGCSTSRSARARWDWQPMLWIVAIAHDAGRRGARAHRRPT